MRRHPPESPLSHLSPSLLSKMSLALLAVFSAPALAVASTDEVIYAKSPSNLDATTIRAEQMTGRPSRILNLDGQVEIVRGPSTIDADTAEYHAIEDVVTANGSVQMLRNKDCYTGDTLEMQMDTGAGYLTNPIYRLEKNNAQGFAKRMDFVDNDRSIIERGVYTTCEGTTPDWYLKSSSLDLDTGRDEGVAKDGVVYFKNVPILASPWMSFPISESRRSGFLPPEYTSTTTGGAELAVPYYLNIAPNRDATILPKFISKRGIQLGGEFRYLDPTYSGISHAEITPTDDVTDTTRYSMSVIHNQMLMPNLSLAVNYNRASDDQYAVDYSHSITDSSQHLLPQSFSLTYGLPWGYIGLATTNYQVLQDANNSIGKPYEIMPKLYGQIGRVDTFGFDWTIGAEYTRFLHPTAVRGDRFALNAEISYPISGTYYFITPKAKYHISDYHLAGNIPVGMAPTPTLSLPTFSLDSGLFFERDANVFGRNITQTLEPRLFYVRTPYHDQSQIPLFDTGISDVNFYQIFTENRFSGQDRVGDANQLTGGLISRAIEMDGQERVRLGLAQRFSFQKSRVVDAPIFYSAQLVGNQLVYTPHSTLPASSDLIFSASGKVTNTISADALWQYSQSQNNTNQMSYGLRWQPGPMKVINAEYRYQGISEVNPAAMRQLDLSAQWPIAKRWYGVARTNYSIADRRILDGLVGFEYKQDCWIFRAVAQRYLVASTIPQITSSATTSLFLQLELNGLSKIGSNPLQVLRRSIPGYQPINQPTTQASYQ